MPAYSYLKNIDTVVFPQAAISSADEDGGDDLEDEESDEDLDESEDLDEADEDEDM